MNVTEGIVRERKTPQEDFALGSKGVIDQVLWDDSCQVKFRERHFGAEQNEIFPPRPFLQSEYGLQNSTASIVPYSIIGH